MYDDSLSNGRTILRRLKTTGISTGALMSLGLVAGGSIVAMAMFVLATRVMTEAGFGVFATWFSAMSYLAVIAACGQETLVLRTWHEYSQRKEWTMARGALKFAMTLTVLGASIVGILIILAGIWLSWNWTVTASAAAFAFMLTLVTFFNHAGRAMISIATGDGVGQLLWRALVVFVLAACWTIGKQLKPEELLLILSACAFVSITLLCHRLLRHLPDHVRRANAKHEKRLWWKRSRSMWAANILDASSQHLDVILISFLVSPIAAGGYFIATRLANLLARISAAIHIYASTKISALFQAGRKDELDQTLVKLAGLTLILVTCGISTLVVFGTDILRLFGESYVDAYTVLMVLCGGTAVATLAGPAPALLLMTGNEHRYASILACSLLFRVTLIVILTPQFGVIGTACAWATTAVLTSIVLNLICRFKAGHDPSVVNLSATLLLPNATPAAFQKTPASSPAAMAMPRSRA